MADQADDSETSSPQAGSDGHLRLRRLWWRWSEEWPLSHVVTVVNAVPLLVLWLILPGALLVLSVLCQASALVRELSDRSYARVTWEVPDPTDEPVILEVAYPSKLFLEGPDEAGVPLAVWLLRATPTPKPTANTNLAPSPNLTATTGSSSVPESTIAPPPSPIREPASTPVLPYVVSFHPSNPVMFTDVSGNPVRPEVALTPASLPGPPAVLYIRPARAPLIPLLTRAQVSINVRGPTGKLNTIPKPIAVRRETAWGSVLRLGIDLVTDNTTLLVTLVAALVGFGAQQWRRLGDEKIRKHEQREVALQTIDELADMLETDPAEGARRYLRYLHRAGYPWTDQQVQDRLRTVWEASAPEELRSMAALTLVASDEDSLVRITETIGSRETSSALKWTYERLDEDWQLRVLEVAGVLREWPEFVKVLPGDLIEDVQRRPWHAVLRAWPHLSFWRDAPPVVNADIERALRILGLQGNPFGSERAEADTLLVQCRMDPPWSHILRSTRSVMSVAAAGAGRTATALLFVHDSLRDHDLFPVYCPFGPEASTLRAQMEGVALASARTLLNYLAVKPKEFLECGVARRAAIVHLLERYIGTGGNLTLFLHQAGLPQVGDGLQMLEEMGRLTKDTPIATSLTVDELSVLISEAYPHGFQHVLILLDVQQIGNGETEVSIEYLRSLLDLMDRFTWVGVIVKILLPGAFLKPLLELDNQLTVHPILLEWLEALRQLLKNRLAQFGDDTLAVWCDREARSLSLSPDERLINTAKGTPRGLIKKGNELLRRIGQSGCLLTPTDLDEILGPLSESKNEVDSERAG